MTGEYDAGYESCIDAMFDMVGTLRRNRKPGFCPNCGRRVEE